MVTYNNFSITHINKDGIRTKYNVTGFSADTKILPFNNYGNNMLSWLSSYCKIKSIMFYLNGTGLVGATAQNFVFSGNNISYTLTDNVLNLLANFSAPAFCDTTLMGISGFPLGGSISAGTITVYVEWAYDEEQVSQLILYMLQNGITTKGWGNITAPKLITVANVSTGNIRGQMIDPRSSDVILVAAAGNLESQDIVNYNVSASFILSKVVVTAKISTLALLWPGLGFAIYDSVGNLRIFDNINMSGFINGDLVNFEVDTFGYTIGTSDQIILFLPAQITGASSITIVLYGQQLA